MRSIVSCVLVASLAASLPRVFAQSAPAPSSRQQLREELAELEKAGYRPGDWNNYPENLRNAQAAVEKRRQSDITKNAR